MFKQGGFGITYLAEDIILSREVVIKEYYPSSIVYRDNNNIIIPFIQNIKIYEKGLDAFLDEAKALARFDTNPNIVNIIEYFKANGTAYFVMPFEEGEDLAQYLHKHGKMSETEILNVIFPILKALQEIHKIGMIHRDIKPANIFMRTNKTPLLIDFGTARYAFGKNSKSLTSILTAGYAPIEQYSSTSIQGVYTDIYALGATIYTMATNTIPPESVPRMIMVTTNKEDLLKKLDSKKFTLEFSNAVSKALNIMEKDRYQTIEEFEKALIKDTLETKTVLNSEFAELPKDLDIEQSKNKWYLPWAISFSIVLASALFLYNFLIQDEMIEHENYLKSHIPKKVVKQSIIQDKSYKELVVADRNNVKKEKIELLKKSNQIKNKIYPKKSIKKYKVEEKIKMTPKNLMDTIYGNYDSSKKCWIYEGYCMKIKTFKMINTKKGKRLYVLATGYIEDASHAESGNVGAFIIEKKEGKDIISYQNKYINVGNYSSVGSYGQPPEDWKMIKLSSTDYWGWVGVNIETGQGWFNEYYTIFAPTKSNSINIIAYIPKSSSYSALDSNEEVAVKSKLIIDKKNKNTIVYPLIINMSGYNGDKNFNGKSYRINFDKKKWEYKVPKNMI